MPKIEINGLQIAYEIVGDGSIPAVITPGGRFPKEIGGVRELAEALSEHDFQTIIWDRPNAGESDLCFDGPTESIQNADTLAGLLRALDFAPAYLIGGSAGGRVSLLTAIRHPDVAKQLFLLWLTGGMLPTLVLANHYYYESWAAVARGGMAAVAELPVWRDSLTRNARNRDILMRQDPEAFLRKMDSWAESFVPRKDTPIPDVEPAELRALKLPVTILRSAASDRNHPREISDAVHALIPGSQLLDLPWDDAEWQRQLDSALSTGTSVCSKWPDLAPQIVAWARG
jgi:pimeloyl-ACP methyl ester carboxylesterase